MNIVTRYESEDGVLWLKELDAQRRDAYIVALQKANVCLGDNPRTSEFYNGELFMQHTFDDVKRFIELVGDALYIENLKRCQMWREQPQGIIGRYLDDANDPASRYYYRLQCIDSQNREWGQPYYANNPNPKATEFKGETN